MKYKALKKKLNLAYKELGLLQEWAISEIDKQYDRHEAQMQIAENEIERLNVIIDFLYMRGRE